jgi:DNA-binding NarL/FixJ family response regulator
MLSSIPGAVIVGHAPSAAEAIAGILATTPNAIIVDLLLERGTGFEVLEMLAQQNDVTPVAIVLSNLALEGYRHQSTRLGAAHFFDKSTEIVQMFNLVSQLAKEHQRQHLPNGSRG